MNELTNQIIETKTCSQCGIEQSINNFRCRKKKNGIIVYNNPCQTCKINGIKLVQSNRSYYRIGLEKINKFVLETYEGKCLSTEYKNNKTNLIFECKYGHQWNAIWSNIHKGKWCPKCKPFFGERITKLFFESIFEKRFPKMRPPWLISEKGYRMELDGYCGELGIAFEHHGMQHYKITEFSRTKEELEKRQLDDIRKAQLCKKNNVKLIIIPQVPNLTPINMLKELIKNQCQILQIKIEKDIDELEINFNIDPISFEQLNQYNKFIEIKEKK